MDHKDGFNCNLKTTVCLGKTLIVKTMFSQWRFWNPSRKVSFFHFVWAYVMDVAGNIKLLMATATLQQPCVIKVQFLSNYLNGLSQTEQTRLASVPPAEYVQQEMRMYSNHLSRLSSFVTNRSYIIFCLWKEVCPHTKKLWSSWNTFKGWEECAQFLVAKVMDCPQMKLLKSLKWKSAVLRLIDLLQCTFFYFTHTLFGFIDKLCPTNIWTATAVLITLLTLKN